MKSSTQDADTTQGLGLQLNTLPPVYLLSTHLREDELRNAGDLLRNAGASVINDMSRASLVLCVISTTRRAKFELNTRHIEVEAVYALDDKSLPDMKDSTQIGLGKRRRESSDSEHLQQFLTDNPLYIPSGILVFARLDWLHDSTKAGVPLGIWPYTIYAVKLYKPGWHGPQSPKPKPDAQATPVVFPISPATDNHETDSLDTRHQGRTFKHQRRSKETMKPTLIRETTEEHDYRLHSDRPPTPTWVREGRAYACERITLYESPNDEFLDMLEQIRLGRILIEDQIGVRAYSTSIASLAAYPYKFTDAREIARLPGCDQKIETLFREYQSTGEIEAAKAVDSDPALRIIKGFYEIWGVGAKTARGWYYDRGWRDNDDIVEYGWNDLTRVQQIGLKYLEEFEQKIPRAEVESIASIVKEHARALTDDQLTCTIVGGYRRGKTRSGDVDIILSHPEEDKTHFFIHDLVVSLENGGWITHTLTISDANSQRDQQPLGVRLDSSKGGFDTLDKALLVWQDPTWPGKEESLANDSDAKNPNIHRRVDIIISPWRTVGCAITGWSSGTTFQRDLRRYAKHKHGWKFDSSGVRDRVTGRWVDLERWTDPQTRVKTALEAERRVFEGLGLEYRDPQERCTR